MLSLWGLGFCFILLSTTMASSKIDAPLLENLNEGHTAKVIVSMTDSTEQLFKDLENREYTDRADRLNTVNRELTVFAERSQKNVVKLLEKEKERISITWNILTTSNQIIVTGADLKLVNDIASVANVARIEGEKFAQLQ